MRLAISLVPFLAITSIGAWAGAQPASESAPSAPATQAPTPAPSAPATQAPTPAPSAPATQAPTPAPSAPAVRAPAPASPVPPEEQPESGEETSLQGFWLGGYVGGIPSILGMLSEVPFPAAGGVILGYMLKSVAVGAAVDLVYTRSQESDEEEAEESVTLALGPIVEVSLLRAGHNVLYGMTSLQFTLRYQPETDFSPEEKWYGVRWRIGAGGRHYFGKHVGIGMEAGLGLGYSKREEVEEAGSRTPGREELFLGPYVAVTLATLW